MQEPSRPSITPAQIVAVLIAGIPAVAKLLEAFGVYTLTGSQQDALTGALTWLGVLAGVLIASDAALRSARNAAHAKIVTGTAEPVSGSGLVASPDDAVTGSGTTKTWTQWTQMPTSSPQPDEVGDADALPDYRTEPDPPPDEGDKSANGDIGERES